MKPRWRSAARRELTECLADLRIVGIERTRGSKKISYSMVKELATHRPTACRLSPIVALALRVYVDSKGAGDADTHAFPVRITGQATLDRVRIDGSQVRVATLRPINESIAARSAESIDRREANHTLNFRLQAADCRGLLRFTVMVFEQGPVATSEQAGTSGWQASASSGRSISLPVTGTLTFMHTAPMQIRLVRIAYKNAVRGFDLAPPTVLDFWNAAEFVRVTFPIPRIEVLRESVELYDGDFTSFFKSGGPGPPMTAARHAGLQGLFSKSSTVCDQRRVYPTMSTTSR